MTGKTKLKRGRCLIQKEEKNKLPDSDVNRKVENHKGVMYIVISRPVNPFLIKRRKNKQ